METKEQKSNIDQPVVSGSCFWGHKWTKWQQYEREMVKISTGAEFVQQFQKKYCVRCNEMVVEMVR